MLEIIVLSCTFFFPRQKIVVLAVDFELGSGLWNTMLHYLRSALWCYLGLWMTSLMYLGECKDFFIQLVGALWNLFSLDSYEVHVILWNRKLLLPSIAALPLLMAYAGHTTIIIPKPLVSYVGLEILDLGKHPKISLCFYWKLEFVIFDEVLKFEMHI